MVGRLTFDGSLLQATEHNNTKAGTMIPHLRTLNLPNAPHRPR
jgi:hypothetical protein